MDKKIKEILEAQADLHKVPFVQNALTEKIIDDTGGEGLYNKIEVDLSVAHTDLEIPVSADRLTVETIDDAVTIKLNSVKNPTIDLQKIPEIKGAVKRIYVTNASGSGDLKLLAGSKGMFEFKKKFENLVPADYIIYKSGTKTFCIDTDTREIVSSNTDSAAVINYALANGSYKLIHIKPARYMISTTLLMTQKCCTLEGSNGGYHLGAHDTGLKLDSGVNANLITVTNYFATIRNLFLDGNKSGNTSGHCIYGSTNSDDLHAYENYIFYAKQSGISLTKVGAIVYANNIEYTGESPVYTTSNGGCFEKNIFYRNGWAPEVRGLYNQFICNRIRDNDNEGLAFRSGADGSIAIGNVIMDHGREGMRLKGCKNCIISGNYFIGNGLDTNNTYAQLRIYDDTGAVHATDNLVTGNIFISTNANKPKHSILEAVNQEDNVITGNLCSDAQTSEISHSGTNTIVNSNTGHITENNGTATVLNGNSTIVVAHGLDGTPTTFNISGQHSEVSDIYVTTVGATNFTIVAKDGNTSANRDIYWEAKVR